MITRMQLNGIEALLHPEYGVIKDVSEIGAGHRVVHGEEFSASTLINDGNSNSKTSSLLRFITPANIMGIEACRSIIMNTPMSAVFDTAFHQTMPEKAFLDAVPYEAYEK